MSTSKNPQTQGPQEGAKPTVRFPWLPEHGHHDFEGRPADAHAHRAKAFESHFGADYVYIICPDASTNELYPNIIQQYLAMGCVIMPKADLISAGLGHYVPSGHVVLVIHKDSVAEYNNSVTARALGLVPSSKDDPESGSSMVVSNQGSTLITSD